MSCTYPQATSQHNGGGEGRGRVTVVIVEDFLDKVDNGVVLLHPLSPSFFHFFSDLSHCEVVQWKQLVPWLSTFTFLLSLLPLLPSLLSQLDKTWLNDSILATCA